MKRILAAITAAMMMCACFTACAKTEEEPSPTTVSASAEPTPTPTPTPEPTPEPTPDNVSPTTGLEGNTIYKPIIVQIDNESKGARPQTNIQAADIVYEAPVEANDVRLTALYNDALNGANAPEELIVGPVRSSRYYHQRIQQEWDALFVHNGAPDITGVYETNVWGESSAHVKQRVNGAGQHAVHTELFFALKPGQSASAYAGVDLMKALALYEYEPEQVQHFKFYPEQSYPDAPEIMQIDLSFYRSPGFVSYTYDAEKDKLTRSMNGEEHKDAATDEAIEVQNLIVQYVSGIEDTGDAEGGRKIVPLLGGGKAEYVIHGKHLTGSWSRSAYEDRTVFVLDSGEEVTLAPGNTWIEIHPADREVVTTYAD